AALVPTRDGPSRDVLDQVPADAAAALIRMDGDLLDVRAAVDLVDEHVRKREVMVIRSDERALVLDVGQQLGDRRGLGSGDGFHADAREEPACRALDSLQVLQISFGCRPDLQRSPPASSACASATNSCGSSASARVAAAWPIAAIASVA